MLGNLGTPKRSSTKPWSFSTRLRSRTPHKRERRLPSLRKPQGSLHFRLAALQARCALVTAAIGPRLLKWIATKRQLSGYTGHQTNVVMPAARGPTRQNLFCNGP
jgi:hypothetical protein